MDRRSIGAIKIVGGELRGRGLKVPREAGVRPMRQQVREALFSFLADQLPGSNAVDLFAGSGSLGFEALSRGAAKVTFCERSRECVRVLEENSRALGVEQRAKIKRMDLSRGVSALSGVGPIDLVLMDPPFELMRRQPARGRADVCRILEEFAQGSLLAASGKIAFESPSRTFRIENRLAEWGLELELRREYGSTALWILARETSPEDPTPEVESQRPEEHL